MEMPQVDQAFAEMTELMDLDVTGIVTLEPVEQARQALLDDFSEHIITLGDVNSEDIDEMATAVDVLTELMMKSFENCEGLEIGDEIVAYGNTLVILVDDALGVDFNVLGDDVRLRGAVASIEVFEIPAQSELSRIRNPTFDNEECEEVKLNPFGVVLQIDFASIASGNDEEAIDDACAVFLPLNYPQLKLFRRTMS